MKIKISIISITALLIVSSFFVLQNFALAINAPTVEFIDGDDILQNGGTDDPYDSLIVFTITPSEPSLGNEIEYSNNGGDDWYEVEAVYNQGQGVYLWSTSGIYAPTLLFRARCDHGLEFSEYFYANLSLSHRQTNHGAHYFVEDFTSHDYHGDSNQTFLDVDTAKLRLARDGGEDPENPFFGSGWQISNNLLEGVGNDVITKIVFQPVQLTLDQTIEYQFSNNGTDWTDLIFYSGSDLIPVPPAVEVDFTSEGDQLFYLVIMSSNDEEVSPEIYQLRFDWQENYTPQACFIAEPHSSFDPDQVFNFNASCTTDYEEPSNQLMYRWDFNSQDGNGIFELDWLVGQSNVNYVYGSTSTQTILLEVRDSHGAVDSFTGMVNTEDIESTIYGWAWSPNYGWHSLNCDNIYFEESQNWCASSNYGLTLNPNGTIVGWVWSSNIGWLCFGSTCDSATYGYVPSPPANPNTEAIAVYNRENGEISGWGKFPVYGNASENGWLSLRSEIDCDFNPPDDQCVHIDLETHRIDGWAWNGFRSEQYQKRGVGWLKFYGNISLPWLETKYGLVYGRGSVSSTDVYGAPGDRYNATYCIRAGTGEITNFTSESGCSEPLYGDLGYPDVSNKYRTILGLIDFDRLQTSYETEDFVNDDVDLAMADHTVLGNKVYNFTGFDDYYISEPITFYNARNYNSSGAGTIFIDGNLHINSNLYFEDSVVTSQIENLASIVWIVKGDVYIDPSITKIAGNFIVLGSDGTPCVDEVSGTGCGEFHTGDDVDHQLLVNGLVMARKFYFERTYREGGEPAEQIIYDGRVIINTPPGMEDIAKGLPVWREAVASTEIED